MAKIAVLSPQVANMIAAGEVVERPSSVIKELMENSIDAGARNLTVEIRGGGILYMRITDDGCGMEPEDAKTAFLRHATSKIKYENDLTAIHTLGFRGEALAAIAAVSKVDLFTKPAAAPLGTHLILESGEVISEEETGCPDGTTLVIKDLFYNTPARMKFLKKDQTEAAYIASAVEQVAMAHPEIAIRFIKDGKEQLYTSGNGNLLSVIYAIYGKEFSGQMVAFSGSQREVQVMGYLSAPGYSRGNRGMQVFMVNGRAIRSKLLTAAVEQAYSGYMMHGRFPACFLDLKINASAVDVNVHPAKMEVKFAHEKEVFSTVYQFVTSALEGQAAAAEAEPAAESKPQAPAAESAYRPAAATGYRSPLFTIPESERQSAAKLASDAKTLYQTKFEPREASAFTEKEAVVKPEEKSFGGAREETLLRIGGYRTGRQGISVEISPEEAEALEGTAPAEEAKKQACPAEEQTAKQQEAPAAVTVPVKTEEEFSAPKEENGREESPEFRLIGELFATYIVVQIGDEMVMIDKHAAHERMIYNKIVDQSGGEDAQTLLAPMPISVSRLEKAALMEQRQQLEKVGFEVEDFGDSSVLVRRVPMYVQEKDINYILTDIAQKMMDLRRARADALEEIIKSVSCKTAVKAGTFTDIDEMRNFTQKVLADPKVRSCPHGRPVLFSMSRQEIEKQFKRIV